MARRLLAGVVLLLALAGCGNDDESGADDTEDNPTVATTTGTTGDGGSDGISAADRTAIEETVREFLVTGDCDLATVEYLRDISLFAEDDATREEACAAWEKVYSKPLFTKEDVLLTDLTVSDGVATVKVGSEIAPKLTTLYRVTLVDGAWLVSGDEYNTDGL